MSLVLKDVLSQYMNAIGGGEIYPTAIDGLTLMRASCESMPKHLIYRPALCVVVQGAKCVMLGEEVLEYRESQYLVVSVELPAIGKVIEASEDKPYMAIILEFDVGVMREIMNQLEEPPRSDGDLGLGMFVGDLGSALSDCMLRLVQMLDTPRAIPILYPLIMREIYFWLLTGPTGDRVCTLALSGSHAQRITEAVYLLRDNFARPMRVEELAAVAGMSQSSFHQHFKARTSMTPLQYQKQLRLLEARRLMVAGDKNVMLAALQVGYESASQFSREYTRMFGAPPKRDVIEARKLYRLDELSPHR